MEAEDMKSNDAPNDGPLQYLATHVHNVMEDFEDLVCDIDPIYVQDMNDQLNKDQLHVFNKVRTTIEAQASTDTTSPAELCRLFVSGCGGTGKSYLIKTIRSWIQVSTGNNVVVATPARIAARNVNG